MSEKNELGDTGLFVEEDLPEHPLYIEQRKGISKPHKTKVDKKRQKQSMKNVRK